MRSTVRVAYSPLLVILLAAPLAAHAGETLYNGIALPDEWPPTKYVLSPESPAPPYLASPPKVIPIDVGRQLFVDDFLIENTTLKRTFHQAALHPANPVLKPDKPWEQETYPTAMPFSDGVWYDPADKIFKMWYMGGYCASMCYATSKDGVHWDKPSLDVKPGTNVVFPKRRDSTTVWIDHEEKDPARRYKMFRYDNANRPETGTNDPAQSLHFSGDGIHWKQVAAPRWVRGDRSTVFYNPFRKVWVYGIRDSAESGSLKHARVRRYWENPDALAGADWTEAKAPFWISADRLDPRHPEMNIVPELYNLDCVAYESVILGLFDIWVGQTIHRPKPNYLTVGFSRDGFHWDRSSREPFIPLSERKGDWNWGNVQSAGGCCLVVGDKLYFYVSGRAGVDGSAGSGVCTTGLAVLRRDGFASMDAGEKTETLTTRPLVFKGKHLFINSDAAGGEIRVDVLQADGKPLDLLTHRRCIPVTTNRTLQPVRWAEAFDLSSVAGKPVRFRFQLTNAKLYSFWVSPDESGASYGYVAAGGPGFTEPRDTVGRAACQAAAKLEPCSTIQPASSQPTAGLPRTGEDPAKGWVCVNPFAQFSPRDTGEDFVFAGRMWMSNGWAPRPSDPKANELSRDLWNSPDGITWTRVSDNTPYDPYSEMVVYKNKVWAIKGSVWNSEDGVQWNRVLEKTPFGGRGYGEAVVHRDLIWQLGSGEDVWLSGDGVFWTCVKTKAPYGNRACTAVAAFDGKLWVMGGRIEATNNPPEKGYKQFTSYNDVWCSTDGVDWTCVTEHAPWAPRMWSVATVYAGRLWLIGGYDNRNHRNLADVWSTTDGKVWTQFESPTRFAPRHEVTPYVFDGSLWVVAGNTWPVLNDVWRLTLPGGQGQ